MQNNEFRPNQTLEYLFLDLNSYFASVEQQENPALIGKPVAIVPAMTDATCAIAASYEAKAYGIRTGTKIYEAKKLCPDLVCILARHDVYVKYHHRIFNELERHIHITKICSVDEAACLLMRQDRDPTAAIELAQTIKQALRENIGDAIKCSIGIAPNMFLAKTASNMQKPDGLTLLMPNQLQASLFRLKLSDLTGIGHNIERRLNSAGIYSVENLWNITPKHARKIWGSVSGEKFWYKLRGYSIPDQPTKKSVIGHSRMLDPAHRPPAEAYQITRHLTNKASARLRRYEMYTSCLSLSLRTVSGQRWSRSVSFSDTQDTFKLISHLERLWNLMAEQLNPRDVLKTSVSLTQLKTQQLVTLDLFEDYTPEKRTLQNKRLSSAIDTLNQTYGAQTITIGACLKTSAGHVGTKIAFNRIPEEGEFKE